MYLYSVNVTSSFVSCKPDCCAIMCHYPSSMMNNVALFVCLFKKTQIGLNNDLGIGYHASVWCIEAFRSALQSMLLIKYYNVVLVYAYLNTSNVLIYILLRFLLCFCCNAKASWKTQQELVFKCDVLEPAWYRFYISKGPLFVVVSSEDQAYVDT